jgi:anaerobic ribonucleoside-triphosphate reductase
MNPDTTENKIKFINNYIKAKNAATGSEVDQNANVATKNIATMAAELPKKDIIALNRQLMYDRLTEKYSKEVADRYISDIESHKDYKHDETSIFPYCCSISLYPFILNGLKEIGGSSGAPKHLDSFCGGYINLVFLVAGQFAGATATPEFLTYFDHFARIDYGEDYINHLNDVVEHLKSGDVSLKDKIEHYFAQVVYTLNQPAGARGYQSVFLNIAYFDKDYFAAIFKDFVFPDGDLPKWETTKELQKLFMRWFNQERLKNILTFPVETANMHVVDGKYSDTEMADFFSEMWAEGASFFMYQSNSVDSLSSCCRLRNGIEDNIFSYTLGAGGIETGSKGVITMNLNRMVQLWDREGRKTSLADYIANEVDYVHKYLDAFNDIIWGYYNGGLLTIYKAGFISLDKQYLTVGINGFVEGAEYLGIKIDPDNPDYQKYAQDILGTIKKSNIAARTEHCKFNTEFVPAESLGVKNAKWDKSDGFKVPRDCYNSYFYVVEDRELDPVIKFRYQGQMFAGACDGGSALHNNLDEHLTAKQYRALMDVAVAEGCSYFTYNVMNTICNHCGYISKNTLDKCPKCGSTDLDYATRIIGYLKRISSFSAARQIEAAKRAYAALKESDKHD